jgi:ribose transport system permease protein
MKQVTKYLRSTIAGPVIALLLIVIVAALTTSRFLLAQNLINLSLEVAIVAIVAIGGTLVILTGGIDLSPGSIVALVCVSLAYLVRNLGISLPIAIILVLILGVLMGLINGFLSSYGKIPPFIVTLATMNIFRGIAYLITNGLTIFSVSPDLAPIFYGKLFNIPLPFYYVLVLYIIVAIFLRNSILGRSIYAVGGNISAAHLTGISVNKVKMMAYMIAGFTAAIAGVLQTAWLNSGAPSYGANLGLDSIAAAVIGGASLVGGFGNILASLVGALIVTIVQNVLNLHAVQAAWQDVSLGIVLVLAVGMDMWKGSFGLSFLRRSRNQKCSADDEDPVDK